MGERPVGGAATSPGPRQCRDVAGRRRWGQELAFQVSVAEDSRRYISASPAARSSAQGGAGVADAAQIDGATVGHAERRIELRDAKGRQLDRRVDSLGVDGLDGEGLRGGQSGDRN